MLHHKNPKSFDLGFFAWAVQDENSTATPQARQTTAQWAVVCRAVSNLQECLPRLCEPDSLRERVRVRFLFIGGFAEGLLGTVNEQRQGITMIVVSCLLLCGIKFALCELDRHLYGALRAIAAYVRTGSLYTSGKV